MKQIILIILSIIFLSKIYGQEFNKNIDKDSLLKEILKDLPKDKMNEFLKLYKEGSDESKEFLLLMFSMPRSSKNKQIENIDKNKGNIMILKSNYAKLVPDSLIIMIEFNPQNNILNTKENIDIKILRKLENNKTEFIAQKWNLEYNSDELKEILRKIGWENSVLSIIKTLLDRANCISIENGKINTIGFARNGMGKYSYKIFEHELDDNEKKEYNDGCNYIYYKDNVVLEYGGGAIGSQCFPDEK